MNVHHLRCGAGYGLQLYPVHDLRSTPPSPRRTRAIWRPQPIWAPTRYRASCGSPSPLSLPGVLSGITLVFLPAVSSFFIPKLLGGGQYVLIGNVIETQFLTSGDWNFGSAISLIMAVIIMISMYITRKVDTDPAARGKED